MLAVAGHAAVQEPQKADIYFVPFSHLDFFWGGTCEECVSRGNRIIAKAIQLAKESPQFRFLLEEDLDTTSQKELRGGPYVIKTIKLDYP
jgi:hypothetical protein